MHYTTINIQGNLISDEIIQKIDSRETAGQSERDFGLESGMTLRSEIERAWSHIKLDWKHYKDRMENIPDSDPYGTAISMRWMESFLSTIGFNLSRQRSSLQGNNGQSYLISHIAENLDGLPIHLTGFTTRDRSEKNTLDIKSREGASKFSPQGLVQEFLNVTEHVYGIAANGYFIRLIRDSGRLVKLAYIEFDIKRLLDEDKYSEFNILFRLIHASRFPKTQGDAQHSWLETYHRESIETGNRIREGLSAAVKESLLALGSGYLRHPDNNRLRQLIQAGDLTPKDYYRQLLRIIYRLLFLMVTEDRHLIHDEEDQGVDANKKRKIYYDFYSISRLRKLSQKRYLYENQYTDLWAGLINTFRMFDIGSTGTRMDIKPLGGNLFDLDLISDILHSTISNQLLLECVKNLNEFEDKDRNLVQINYRSLDVEELGSVYEGLLELHPVIQNIQSNDPYQIVFTFHEGTERKTTGSYYTRPELVNELIKSALIPVIEDRLKKAEGKENRIRALLQLKVCDPAAGSGHMMLAAARTIAWYLARIESEEDNPAPTIYRKCLRDVIQHCIYAVDMNPDAVELCKLAFWLEGHNSGKPLSFLDHKIKNGNSLVGVTDLKVLSQPLPDDAFNPVTGDDTAVCRELKRRNAAFKRTAQTDLFTSFGESIKVDTTSSVKALNEIEWISQDTLDGVNAVKDQFQKIRTKLYHEQNACHIWTSAFVKTYTSIDDNTNPTSERLVQFFSSPSQYGQLVGSATALANEYKFFHWPLEFPDVFSQGGFDVMLGNPPWERIKLQEQEFFSTYDSSISNARTASERKKLINNLPNTNPALFQAYVDASHNAESTSKFIRECHRFELTARGDINTYAIFTELFYSNINPYGIAAIIVPTGIATDSTTSVFFSSLMKSGKIKSLFDFVNEKMLFPAVLHNFHFSLLTITGNKINSKQSVFSFNNQQIEHLQQEIRHFSLSFKEIEILNPETNTLPILTSKYDANIMLNMHLHNTFLSVEGEYPKTWNAELFSLFHMTNDSNLFHNKSSNNFIPLYEAKMFYQYDHRYGTYDSNTDVRLHMLPKTQIFNYVNACFKVTSSFFISISEVTSRVKEKWKYKWFLAFRSISSGQLERTFTSTILPYCGTGNSCILVNPIRGNSIDSGLLLSVFNSIPFDYITRQKSSGANLNFFKVRQLPLPAPHILINYRNIIIPSVLELTFSAWDIKNFIDDIWKEADERLKIAIQGQWEANKSITGGHEPNPPDWCEIDPEGCPLPPFKWDEDRRAVLKADLDAIYAHLYGLTTDELRYILDPQDVHGPDFPGETFRVLKEKEIRLFGEYRTKRLVMEAWDRMGYNQ